MGVAIVAHSAHLFEGYRAPTKEGSSLVSTAAMHAHLHVAPLWRDSSFSQCFEEGHEWLNIPHQTVGGIFNHPAYVVVFAEEG